MSIDENVSLYHLEFRSFHSLTYDEKNILKTLTSTHGGRRSLFQQWLKHPNPTGFYAVLVSSQDRIIAWSAVSTLEGAGEKKGIVGVFVNPEHRGRGIAHQALDALLANLSAIENESHKPNYLSYNQGMEQLFRPAIERYGFKDAYHHC